VSTWLVLTNGQIGESVLNMHVSDLVAGIHVSRHRISVT